jgi:DNA polymerase IV
MAAAAATILHADLDAFYASVEQLLDPSLRGRPVAVGGGVVLAASYEARAFGVRGGMPGSVARRLCPGLRFVGGHFDTYRDLADQVLTVFESFTPLVERISIDEAFLDVAGSVHLFGPPEHIAAEIRRRVRDGTGLPVSVGVASTKHLAKVASQVAKPDGLVVVAPGEEAGFLAPLPVELLWGVGPATLRRLAAKGIHTIGDLVDVSEAALQRMLGRAAGSQLAARAANVDARRVRPPRRSSSMGAQSALGRREATPALLEEALGHLADRVATRLRRAGLAGRTVTVRVRFADLRSVTRSVTLASPTCSTRALTEVAVTLAQRALADEGERVLSLVGVAVSALTADPGIQLELPFPARPQPAGPQPAKEPDRWALDRAVDVVRERFGKDALGYAGVAFSAARGAPDGFRQLAERDGARRSPSGDAGRVRSDGSGPM